MAATLQTLIIERRWEKSEFHGEMVLLENHSDINYISIYIYTHVFVSFFLTRSPKFIYTEN